jgi:hypothetical protein
MSAGLPLASKALQHRRELYRQEGVAIQYEERLVEHSLVERQPQRAAGSAKFGPFVDVAQRAHRRRLGCPILADLLALMRDAIDDVVDALRRQPLHLMPRKRTARHRQQGLGTNVP